MQKNKVTIRGRTYDLNDVGDLASIQAVLVSDNWPTKRADGVKLFLSLQNMLSLQLKRHLAANFKTIMKNALEEGAEGGTAEMSVNFGFTVDLTAPTVATISAHKLSFSVKHETKGKPQTYDLTQGEFIDDDMNVVLDVKGFEKENSAPPEDALPPTTEEGDVTPETEPGTPPAKKPRKPRAKKD